MAATRVPAADATWELRNDNEGDEVETLCQEIWVVKIAQSLGIRWEKPGIPDREPTPATH